MDALTNFRISFDVKCSSEYIEIVEGLVEKWNSKESQFYFKTSGSSGKPKTIELSRSHILASILSTAKHFSFFQGMKSAIAIDIVTIAGAMMLFRALEFNMDIQVLEVRRRINWKGELDFLSLVPQQALELNSDRYKKVKNVLIGGGPIFNYQEKYLSQMPSQIFHGFGMTETISHFAIRKIAPEIENQYLCLDGVKVESWNGALKVTIRDRGIVDLLTTDNVEVMNDNKSFRWLGRLDGAILSAGKKIHPEEIEKIVSEFYPNHPEGFAGVVKDDDWHESLIWFSIPLNPLEHEKLRKVFGNLPKWKRPKKIIQKASLPLTKSGKYKRR
tara:strand:- start:670 stop:1659 length:990 start_codon:yes stop_codon:yes gene_type:complete